MTDVPFEEPLHAGTLLKRYKRFLADIELDDGTEVTAHCANSGSMLGMKEPGSRVMLKHVSDPKRKLKWTWELVQPPGEAWIGCNTQRPNPVTEALIAAGKVPGLTADHGMRREVMYGTNSRIDLLLGNDDVGFNYVEIKNTTLAEDGVARFPDAVTSRGAKHMDELAAMRDEGHDATVVFFVNRADCDRFDVARDIDPKYGEAFDRAMDAGVRALPLGMDVSPDGWTVRGELPRL